MPAAWRIRSVTITFSRRTLPRLLAAGCAVLTVQTVHAKPASYVPDRQWTKEAWQCKTAGKSSIELESLRQPTSFITNLKVVDLRINRRKIRSTSVTGLDAFVATLDALQVISGRCGWTGEFVIIRGFVRGRSDPKVSEEQQFFIPYAR